MASDDPLERKRNLSGWGEVYPGHVFFSFLSSSRTLGELAERDLIQCLVLAGRGTLISDS
jgi:hypothetical protein